MIRDTQSRLKWRIPQKVSPKPYLGDFFAPVIASGTSWFYSRSRAHYISSKNFCKLKYHCLRCKMRLSPPWSPIRRSERRWLSVEIFTWILKTVAEAAIFYGVGKALDWFVKRRWSKCQIASETTHPPKGFSRTWRGIFLRLWCSVELHDSYMDYSCIINHAENFCKLKYHCLSCKMSLSPPKIPFWLRKGGGKNGDSFLGSKDSVRLRHRLWRPRSAQLVA